MAAFVKGSAFSSSATTSTSAAAATPATAEGAPTTVCTSYVAIILDITGSMSNQIQGVKNAVRELLPILAENPRLGIAIITFTEGGRSKNGQTGSYVSVNVFSEPTEADSFVRGITLAKPPGNPGVSACGDDGDENAKAALYALKELDGGKPTVAFFITDAGYHRTKRESPTAQAEDDYLLGKGASDTDFYVLFDSVLAHFNGNLVVVPIVYGFERLQAHAVQAYGQVAMTSGGGVVIQPNHNSMQTLTLTMATFVIRLLGQLNGQADLPPGPPEAMLTALRLFDATDMTRLAADAPTSGLPPSVGDACALFESAMTRTATAFKVSWKRCIDVNKVSLLRQLVFALTAAKFVLAVTTGSPLCEELMLRLEESFPAVLEAVPEQQRGHIKATPQVIKALAAELATAKTDGEGGGGSEVVDSVSLETVRDTLEAALDEEMRVAAGDETVSEEPSVKDPLQAVFSMVHGIFVNVRFPPGPDGKPNFADAWSAMIDKHSFDVVSAESAMRLFASGEGGYAEEGDEEEEGMAVVGLTDRRKYNGFVPLMDEGDPLKTAVMTVFSGLQVMNLLQMTVLAGSPGGFLPNMYPGMVAATLARVIRTSSGGSWAGVEGASGEANDRLASQMVFSLRGIMGSPAKTARVRLAEGKADPANPLSKFLMVLCKHPRGSKKEEEDFRRKMRLVLNEWVAATVQLHFGKATPENDAKFYAFVQEVLPLEAIFGKDALEIDPLERLHPLEAAEGVEAGKIPVVDGWQSTGLTNLSKTTLHKDIRRLTDRCRVVFDCLEMDYELDDIILDYVIYRFRTARYNFTEPPPDSLKDAGEGASASGTTDPKASRAEKGTHEPIEEMPSTLFMMLKIYKGALRSELAAMKEARKTHAVNALTARVVSAGAVTAKNRSMELLGTVYSLNRTDVPSILELTGYGNLSFVEELILGDWTPEPPQCLRRFSFDILRSVDEAGGGGEGGLSERLRDAISQRELCARTLRSNRHGHSAALTYPGPMGWTEEYAEARLANLADTGHGGAVRILPQMKRYTEFGQEVLRRLDEGVVAGVVPAGATGEGSGSASDLSKEVRRVLYSFEDANCLPRVVDGINKFGVPKLLEGLVEK